MTDENISYFRVGDSYTKQTLIPGGFKWEPMEPGVYESQQTGRRIRIVPTKGFHCRLDAIQSDSTSDSWDVKGTFEWEGLSRSQELGILMGFYEQIGGYLSKAVELAASKGITPAPVDSRDTTQRS